MNRCFLKKICRLAIIIVISFLSGYCSINKTVSAHQPSLSGEEFSLVDNWVKRNLASCSFLFTSEKDVDLGVKIMRCIQDFDMQYQQSYKIPEYLKRKIFPQRIDYYLTGKISSYLSEKKLSTSQLTTLLYFITNVPYGENVNLVKLLIDKGADTKNITIQQNLSTNGSTCRSSLVILKSNLKLYQNESTLNEPVNNMEIFLTDKGYDKKSIGKTYRNNVLFFLLADPAYLHCRSPVFLPKLIDSIVRINPSLRDVVDMKTGRTPLHLYCRYFQTRGLLNPVALGKRLMDKKNINKMDKRGWTPLHTLLIKQSLNKSIEYTLMVKALIDAGANIDLKNKNGTTPRMLISKHPTLRNEINALN